MSELIFVSETPAHRASDQYASFKAHRIPARNVVSTHSHDCDQFICTRSGVMQVMVNGASVFLPPQYGMWIPAGVLHSVSNTEDVSLETLYLKAGEFNLPKADVRVLMVSPLVQEFIHYACRTISGSYASQGAGSALKLTVLLKLIEELPPAPLELPFPQSTALVRMCAAIQEAPDMAHLIEEWSERLHTSPRTLSRNFQKETGMAFYAWKQRLRLLLSLKYLQAGRGVTNTALSLGYCSPSAYISAFKQAFGCTPGRFSRTD